MTNKNEWEKEFEDRFYTDDGEEKWLDNGYGSAPDEKLGDKIKSFISDLLSRHDKERTAEVVGMVEKMKSERKIPWQAINLGDNCPNCGAAKNQEYVDRKFKEAVDNALDDILTTLRSPEGEECADCQGSGEGIDRGAAADGYESYCRRCDGRGTPHSSGGETK